MVKVKICGITNVDDALMAEGYGADALGFIFYIRSERFVDPQVVKNISQKLNPFTAKVGVFVNEPLEQIISIAKQCNLTHIQLHGNEDRTYAESLSLPVIRALNFSASLKKDINLWRDYSILLDSGTDEKPGGTGEQLPWKKIKQIIGNTSVILAGGLTVDNIEQAIQQINPSTVDVSSGVEKGKGLKDEWLVKKFIEKVKYL